MTDHHPSHSPSESESRTRILQAAYDLFVAHGFKAVSMQQIADAALIHKATLYHHFVSKEALFLEVVTIAFADIHRDVETVIEQGGTAVDQLVLVAGRLFAQTQSDMSRLMTDLHEQIAPEHRLALLRDHSYPWEPMERIMVEAIRTRELPDVEPEFAVSMFLGLVWGQIFMRRLERLTGPLDEHLARTLVEILFAGLRASPAAMASARLAVSPSPGH